MLADICMYMFGWSVEFELTLSGSSGYRQNWFLHYSNNNDEEVEKRS